MRHLLFALAMVAGPATLVYAQTPNASTFPQETRPAVPVEPTSAIIEAFRSHSIVAIGDNHGNQQGHAFRLALIRNPKFAATANDIVVEFGSARYQNEMDRFVRGEEVPYETLRLAWQDTTQPEYEWDLPIYEEFFRAVRAVNASLPRERQLRVLLGDPPIDWDDLRERSLEQWVADRDTHAVRVIRQEVLGKGRRALVIYGSYHLIRKNTSAGAADEWASGLVAQIERAGLAKVFTINPEIRRDLKTLQANVDSWSKPSLALLRGTTFGAVNFAQTPRQRSVRMEEQFDAILYFGPPSAMTFAQLSPTLCSDKTYIQMRLSRLAMVPPPPGAPITPADRLKEYCANPQGTAIADREPKITELVRQIIRDAAQGKVDPASIAPESRERLTKFLQQNGPRFLGRAGALESLTLLAETNVDGRRVRSYRAVFATGQKIRWSVGLSAAGAIMSLDPRPE